MTTGDHGDGLGLILAEDALRHALHGSHEGYFLRHSGPELGLEGIDRIAGLLTAQERLTRGGRWRGAFSATLRGGTGQGCVGGGGAIVIIVAAEIVFDAVVLVVVAVTFLDPLDFLRDHLVKLRIFLLGRDDGTGLGRCSSRFGVGESRRFSSSIQRDAGLLHLAEVGAAHAAVGLPLRLLGTARDGTIRADLLLGPLGDGDGGEGSQVVLGSRTIGSGAIGAIAGDLGGEGEVAAAHIAVAGSLAELGAALDLALDLVCAIGLPSRSLLLLLLGGRLLLLGSGGFLALALPHSAGLEVVRAAHVAVRRSLRLLGAAVDDAAGPKFLTGHGQRLDGHFVELGIGLLLNLDEVLPTHVVVLGPLGLSCLDWYGGIWNQSNRYQGKIKVK